MKDRERRIDAKNDVGGDTSSRQSFSRRREHELYTIMMEESEVEVVINYWHATNTRGNDFEVMKR